MDGKHVVVGQVINGFEVLDAIEECAEHPSGKTWKRVYVYECGELDASAVRATRRKKRRDKERKKKDKRKVGPADAAAATEP